MTPRLTSLYESCCHWINDGLSMDWFTNDTVLSQPQPMEPLTHLGWDKMAVIIQTTFPSAFSWMQMYKFRSRFDWSLFPRIQLTIFHNWLISLLPTYLVGSDNGLLHGWCQAIIWTNAGILLIWPLGTNFSEILIKTHTLSFKKMHFKMSSGKCQPSCLGLNVLKANKSFL